LYFEEAEAAGVRIYRHQPGFLHQKVMLVDDQTSIIGTHNLENRSMRLNFEVTMVMLSKEFAKEVEAMLKNDFSNSKLASAKEYTDSSLPYRFLIRASRLTAPVQ
jgi:cardiolipin synthase